jgi:cell division transport system permease protein
MAGVLLASSLFLIVNTIRLATFARRREIEVMKLVGASNWFVRVPFMAEGLVQGAIGAGISFGLVFILKSVLVDLTTNPNRGKTGLFTGFYVTNGDAVTIGFVVLLIGAAIGVVGSTIGLRRFLEG